MISSYIYRDKSSYILLYIYMISSYIYRDNTVDDQTSFRQHSCIYYMIYIYDIIIYILYDIYIYIYDIILITTTETEITHLMFQTKHFVRLYILYICIIYIYILYIYIYNVYIFYIYCTGILYYIYIILL